MKRTTNTRTIYQCPDALVTVIKKIKGLQRYPKHGYACLLYLLRPTKGTRVCTARDGRIEYMPSFDELRAMLIAIEPNLAKAIPSTIRNKPPQRKKHFDALNAARHRRA